MARQGDDRAVRIGLYRHAIELGIRCFDTAPLYGFGLAETLLGEAVAPYPRDQLLILGKVGLRWDAGDYGDVLFAFDDPSGRRRTVRKDSRPESVVAEVERSLQRLGTDYLDLVQIHHPDPTTPIGETMGALEDLLRQGTIRRIGVSNFSLAQVRAAQNALRHTALCSLQSDYSLLNRDVERDILGHCRATSVAFLAYSPLAGGHLARVGSDGRAARSRSLERAIAGALRPLAERHATSPAAIALAWLNSQPGVTAAITGASTRDQLQAQAGAQRVSLSGTEIDGLSRAFAGVRLPVAGRSLTSRGYRMVRRLGGRALRSVGIDPSAWRRRGVPPGW